jgi:hypothetical protein
MAQRPRQAERVLTAVREIDDLLRLIGSDDDLCQFRHGFAVDDRQRIQVGGIGSVRQQRIGQQPVEVSALRDARAPFAHAPRAIGLEVPLHGPRVGDSFLVALAVGAIHDCQTGLRFGGRRAANFNSCKADIVTSTVPTRMPSSWGNQVKLR